MLLTKQCAQLNKLSKTCKSTGLSNICMSDYSLSNALCLIFRSTGLLLEETESSEGAVVFERHPCSVQISMRGTDVVQKTGQEVCLEHGLPYRKEIFHYCGT